jgi:ArsR family transcriptional regulator, arsenate/arsenite/antimonite-responsive transcriptional repressor
VNDEEITSEGAAAGATAHAPARASAPAAFPPPPPSSCATPESADLERLASVAKALSDPIRLGMLDLMAQGRDCCGFTDPAARGVPGSEDPEGICVCEFQEQFGLGQSKASYHLRVLKDAGLVREQTRGKWSFYSLDRDVVVAAWRDLQDLLRI